MTTKIPVELSSTPGIVDGSNATAITIDSSERVGIGTSSPATQLQLLNAGESIIRMGYSTTQYAQIGRNSDGTYEFSCYENGGVLKFGTSQSNNATTERMRITATGKVGIGTTSPARTLHVNSSDANVASFEGHQGEGVVISSGTNGQIDIIGYDDGASSYNTLVVRAASAGATFGTNGVVSGDFNDTSDVALKENITDINGGLSIIKQLQPRNFDWKDTNKKNGIAGFIAQEVETILPQEVNGDDYTEGNAGKSINVGGIVAHLTKAIQEQQEQIEQLKTEIQTLKGE